ncbi:ACL134Cp [Eremothecium gossypii ATCC 10895]|uniref:ACL134Cp n=1 Tax=Eremothecium gossypii (strain ATCC 10895 / CBS 109.51 / FGSC 9923 / NRRL Y-1056) TaxID=284811 RepID=Q75CQ3_EREGS|nr:ACL134Cp [Eremothecium gossypii ATCC 10895]AAS51094.1 ACL134Cp [Eremothecium gossypii ATCC 10895]AEY95384.1 FACL134Cp [Eremothecium gossypii FDAG1]
MVSGLSKKKTTAKQLSKLTINTMSEITLGRYLFERLRQIEVQTIFGLPGDFNLSLLDKIYEVEGMRWAGNANELNAAYAADGYARLKGMSCLITTFGVGELSALNGIAGSYAEHVGVLHVVGVPSISAQAKQLLLHHTLGNGDFTVFHRMSANISGTTAMISDITSAPAEIDRCIRTCYITQRPVYLGLPANMVDLKVPASLLETPIDLNLKPNDPEAEAEVVETVLEMIAAAKNPVILSDACASRHDVKAETMKLIDVTQFPAFVTPMGKGSIYEQHPRFGGVYVGTLSSPEVKEAVESADLVLSVGALLSDFNTGSFSYSYKTKNVVEFHSDHIKIRNATFPGVQMKYVLRKLVDNVAEVIKSYVPVPVPSKPANNEEIDSATPLKQEWLWNQVGKFLREGDVVITETGTSAFGINQTHFPNNTYGISQVLWGSIGFTTGACLGAAFAAEELDPNRRVILFIGDGSLQLTVQEISTMVRWGLKPYLFVLNNDGYTIERLIHGETAQYNDIQPWQHLNLLPTFGAKDYEAVRVSTTGEWDALTQDKAFNENSKIRMIEVMLPVMDAPSNLVKQAELTAATNAKQE